MVQMPGGIPVGVLAVGKAGAVNAAILATQVLGLSHAGFDEAVRKQREAKAAEILANLDPSEA
jgi:5-(carboxyamino)imidazole ribonucleotide mutase